MRFAGQDVDGFVLERVEASDHPGRLAPLRRAVSAEPVLAPEIARLSELVAARYAGTRSDVLRLAVPPRHAATEKEPSTATPVDARPEPGGGRGSGAATRAGASCRPALARGESPRAVWTALPGEDWPTALAQAAAAALASGRGSVLCVPDHRDLARLDAALDRGPGAGPPRAAHRRPRPGGALPVVPRGLPRRGAGRRGHPGRGLRAGARPGAGGGLGRRRRPLRRAARALPPHPRGAAPARPRRGVRRPARWVRPQRRGVGARGVRLGARRSSPDARRGPVARAAGEHHRRHRPRARARPRGAVGTAAQQRARRDPRGAGARTGARPGTPPWLRRGAGLRHLPRAGPLPGLHRAPAPAPPAPAAAPAAGAASRPRTGSARPAVGAGSGRPCWATSGPPRSWAARSPG